MRLGEESARPGVTVGAGARRAVSDGYGTSGVGLREAMRRDGLVLTIAAALLLIIGAGLPSLLFGPFHLGGDNAARLQATLTYAGVMVTAAVTLVGSLSGGWLTSG